jgi:nitrogen fixation protein NifU and related proteins
MMENSSMEDLYREAIIRRYQTPSNRREIDDANAEGFSQNPLCGDEIRIRARVADDRIADAGFAARGCSISQASADMMADVIRGKTLPEVASLTAAFRELMTEEGATVPPDLEELAVLRSVKKYPVRIKCALLPWDTLQAALAARS